MKTAIIYAPDWPGDEVVMTFGPDEWAALRQLFDAHEPGQVAGRTVLIIDRIAFATQHRFIAGMVCAGEQPVQIRKLSGQFDRMAFHLRRAREGDRSGDPALGAAPANQMAGA